MIRHTMVDISFSPSKPHEHGAASPLPSPVRSPMFPNHESHNDSHRDPMSSTSRQRVCNSVGSSQNYERDNPISSSVLRARMLSMNNFAIEDRENEHATSVSKPRKSRERSVRDASSLDILASASPSFTGLPEELILEVVFYLDIFDILALRKTNRRLTLITHARVIWLAHLSSFLYQVEIPQNSATFLDSLLSTPAIEQIVMRPQAFAQRWFFSRNHQQYPSTSRALSVIWRAAPNFHLPILLPGGRWLVAVFYTRDAFFQCPSGVCLWDLEHGRCKDFPEAQIEASGWVVLMDVKMDLSGSFAMMSIVTGKMNVVGDVVCCVDVYQIRFLPTSFGFFHLDKLALNDRLVHEIQIYPQVGMVVLDLFDRVLTWAYSPENKCAWLVTSKTRHQLRRFNHRAAHALTLTHELILVADGDESSLRGYPIPPLLNRPTQLSTLVLFVIDPVLDCPLPHFATSLAFSTSRLVDISGFLKDRASFEQQALTGLNIPANGVATTTPAHASTTDALDLGPWLYFERGVLFINAASCDSYRFCSYPLLGISNEADSSNSLIWTSMTRQSVLEQTGIGRKGYGIPGDEAMRISMSRPFNVSPLESGPHIRKPPSAGDLLWIGLVDEINPSLCGEVDELKRPRTVVLMRHPENPEGLAIISVLGPPHVVSENLQEGQAMMTDVEQGEARTVLQSLASKPQLEPQTKITGACVDSISGRVCITGTGPYLTAALRLLEYV